MLMSKDNTIWCVYMVRCSDGTLYTGITNDLEKRIRAHNSGKAGARYTKSRRPVTLAYSEKAGSKSEAASLEYHIKKMARAKKKQLVKGQLKIKNGRARWPHISWDI